MKTTFVKWLALAIFAVPILAACSSGATGAQETLAPLDAKAKAKKEKKETEPQPTK